MPPKSWARRHFSLGRKSKPEAEQSAPVADQPLFWCVPFDTPPEQFFPLYGVATRADVRKNSGARDDSHTLASKAINAAAGTDKDALAALADGVMGGINYGHGTYSDDTGKKGKTTLKLLMKHSPHRMPGMAPRCEWCNSKGRYYADREGAFDNVTACVSLGDNYDIWTCEQCVGNGERRWEQTANQVFVERARLTKRGTREQIPILEPIAAALARTAMAPIAAPLLILEGSQASFNLAIDAIKDCVQMYMTGTIPIADIVKKTALETSLSEMSKLMRDPTSPQLLHVRKTWGMMKELKSNPGRLDLAGALFDNLKEISQWKV